MKRFSPVLALAVVLVVISSSVLALTICYNGGTGDQDMPTPSGSCSNGFGCHGGSSGNGTVILDAVADDGTWDTAGEPGTITATVNIDSANSDADIVGAMIINSGGDNIKDDGWTITQDPNSNDTAYNYNERSGVTGDLVLIWDVNAPTDTGTYYVKARLLFDDGGAVYNESNVVEVSITLVGIAENEAVFKKPLLLENYPNPFTTETAISYQIPLISRTTLRIYDLSGQLVKTLVDDVSHPAGKYTVQWNGKNDRGREVSCGTYLCKFTAGSFTDTKKIIFSK